MLAQATMAGPTCYAGNVCCFNIEHSWAGALWLSGLKQILLTHNVVSQYHSKPIWHAILSMYLSFLLFATVYSLIWEKKKGFRLK